MKLIVGLGNPGPRYERTRHNAGFMVIDRLAERHARGQTPRSRFNAIAQEAAIGGERCVLLKPLTYMNRSGSSVGEAARFYKAAPETDVLVVVDDLALPAGAIRLRPSGGAGGHNGLSDVQRSLGTDAYPRLRVGIDACPAFMAQEDYVLGRFTDEQWALVEPALGRAADAAEAFAISGLSAAMNVFNARARGGGGTEGGKEAEEDPGLDPGWKV